MGCVKQAYKDKKEVTAVSLQSIVIPFASFISFTHSIKKLFRLHYSTLETFLCIIHKHYINGQGCTATYIIKTLGLLESSSTRRSLSYRLATLLSYGLVYCITVKGVRYYYLSDKSKSILEGINKADKK